MDAKEPREPATSFPLRMPKSLDDKMSEGAERTRLSKSDFMRLSMEKGAELVVRAMTMTPEQIMKATEEPEPHAA